MMMIYTASEYYKDVVSISGFWHYHQLEILSWKGFVYFNKVMNNNEARLCTFSKNKFPKINLSSK